MELSILDVLGPVMIGPSSSHTAGAVKLGRTAAEIVSGGFSSVSFGLCGSFAKTADGHGTKEALIAGVLGMEESDERICDAIQYAKKQNLSWSFYETQLEHAHENTVVMTFSTSKGSACVVGSSLGGGRICITSIDGIPVNFTGDRPTLVIRQEDCPGMIEQVAHILAAHKINIALMQVSRQAKGQVAHCIIETDAPISAETLECIRHTAHVLQARVIDFNERKRFFEL